MFQQEVAAWLQELGVEFLENDRKVIGPLEVDFWIPEQRLAIEVSGLYYHSESHGEKDKAYHLNKTRACEEQGVRLIHLWSDEWEFSRNLVKSKIAYLLGRGSPRRVHARACRVVDLSQHEAWGFLEDHHLQGGDRGTCVRKGLVTKSSGELVAVMTWCKPRSALGYRQTSDSSQTMEISRFAVCTGVLCPGGASKLLNSAVVQFPVGTRVVSYADRRWVSCVGSGNFYEKFGFILTGETKPSYWYLLRGEQYKVRHHRFGWRKSVLRKRLGEGLWNPEQTEWEMMRAAGHDRIWDCGNFRYEMTITR